MIMHNFSLGSQAVSNRRSLVFRPYFTIGLAFSKKYCFLYIFIIFVKLSYLWACPSKATDTTRQHVMIKRVDSGSRVEYVWTQEYVFSILL